MVFRGLFFSNYEKSYEKYLLTINSFKSTLHVLIQTLHHWETLLYSRESQGTWKKMNQEEEGDEDDGQ